MVLGSWRVNGDGRLLSRMLLFAPAQRSTWAEVALIFEREEGTLLLMNMEPATPKSNEFEDFRWGSDAADMSKACEIEGLKLQSMWCHLTFMQGLMN